MVWYFIGVYIINTTLHGHLEIRNFSSHVEKSFTSERSERVKYFSTLEDKFRISARPCNILCFFIKYHLILVPDDLKVHLFVLLFDYYSSGFLLAWKKYNDIFL